MCNQQQVRFQSRNRERAFSVNDMTQLRFAPEPLSEIYISHGIEHVWRREAMDMIGKFADWLKADGKLVLITPDFDHNVQEYLLKGGTPPFFLCGVRPLATLGSGVFYIRNS